MALNLVGQGTKFGLDIRIVVAGIVVKRDFNVVHAESPLPPESDQAVTW